MKKRGGGGGAAKVAKGRENQGGGEERCQEVPTENTEDTEKRRDGGERCIRCADGCGSYGEERVECPETKRTEGSRTNVSSENALAL